MEPLHRIKALLLLVIVVVARGEDGDNSTDTEEEGSAGYVRHWGPWTEWSVCGQTCGYSTQYRLRRCHKITEGHRCPGEGKQYKICSMNACPTGHKDYRSTECSKNDHRYYGTRRYRWIPYINEQSPCDLSCKSVGFGYYARFNATVEDYVMCNEKNTAACIQGKCLLSGCDGILGSGTKEDFCGVCGGIGDTCRVISGIFTRVHLAHRGYNVVATIPAGARGINISEISRSKNHLALATSDGYFLNGNRRLNALGLVKGAGTVFNYKRGLRQGCRGECLTADGPTNDTLRIEIIHFGRNPGIKYSYAMPNSYNGQVSGSEVVTDSFESDDDETSELSVKSIPSYVADKNPYPNRQQLNPKQDKEPKTTRNPLKIIRHTKAKILSNRNPDIISSTRSKIPRKFTKKDSAGVIKVASGRKDQRSSGSNPSRSDNQTDDVQYRHYYHTSALDDLGDVPVERGRNRNSKKSGDSAWPRDGRDEPINKVKQRKTPRPSISDNSVPLTPSKQDSRSDNDVISRKDYRQPQYGGRRSRGRGEYSWRISGFTDCTQTCGGGLQQTRVVCMKDDSQVEVMEENCDASARPETTTVVCNNQPCEANWVVSQWTPCSVTCGRGLRRREVDCQQRISPTLTIPVSATTCPSPRPLSRQYCQQDPCYSWKSSNWTTCSTVCGLGQRTRTLTCIDTQGKEVKRHLCPAGDQPSFEEICDLGSCAQGWFHSRWSKECSVDCGRGYYTRKVYCSASDGSALEETKCGASKKPRHTKTCKTALPCGGKWFAGPWLKCNDTCGPNAVRRREVLCIKQHGRRVRGVVKDHNCDESIKPAETEPCEDLPRCKPQWFNMAWSKCSKSCDTGVRTREVTCLDEDLKPSPDCDKKSKPSIRQSCNTNPCEDNYAAFSAKGGKSQILQQDGTIVERPSCEDKNGHKWCRLVSQARLCGYPVYQNLCCKSCHQHKSKG